MNHLKIILAAMVSIFCFLYAEQDTAPIEITELKYQPVPLELDETFQAPQKPLPDWKIFNLPVEGKLFVDPNKDDSQRDTLKGEMKYKLEGSSLGFKGGLGVDKQGSRSIEFGISWGGE